jgi:2'-5' RNA ligase
MAVTNADPHSGLIIEVPEAAAAVARLRERLDASAPLGIPAHVTVLFPFMPPAMIDPGVLTELAHLFGAVSRFRFRLDRTDWFGDEVLWLAPRDPGAFRALTETVYRAYPAYPPFEGRFSDVVPHLTVGKRHPVADLRAAEESVRAHLPIDGHATAVTLVTQQSAGGRWSETATFALA